MSAIDETALDALAAEYGLSRAQVLLSIMAATASGVGGQAAVDELRRNLERAAGKP